LGAGGLQALAKGGLPVRDRRVVVAGSGPLLLAVADFLKRRGAVIPLVAEQARRGAMRGFAPALVRHPGKLLQAASLRTSLAGTPHRFGVWPVRARGRDRLEAVELTDGEHRWVERYRARRAPGLSHRVRIGPGR
jgi:NADPH-dependent 2,4-dienoyl-CoA reductase/sulfur reductase-like enzyme